MSFVWKAERPLRTEEQVAREVHEVSLSRHLDDFASVLTLMAIRQESTFWCPWNRKDSTSHDYDFDSESDDGRSVGYLQQQNKIPGENPTGPGENWWGSMGCRMDLKCAVNTFQTRLAADYRRALGNPYECSVLIDNVQGSYWNGDPAHPGYYGKHYDYCWGLLKRALGDAPIGPTPEPMRPAPSIQPNPQWRGDPLWLPEVLRLFGVDVYEAQGARQRGHGDFGHIDWVLWHHTGNRNETERGITNHPALGLAANLLVFPNGRTCITGFGVAWHGGKGIYPNIPEDGINQVSIGIECAHSGAHGDPWPDEQMRAMINIGAAIKWFLQLPMDNQIAHKEWAGNENPLGINKQGKPDPIDIDMDWFRQEIANRAQAGPTGGEDEMSAEAERMIKELYDEWGPNKRGPSRSIAAEDGNHVDSPLGFLYNIDGNVWTQQTTWAYLFDVPHAVQVVEDIAANGINPETWADAQLDANGQAWLQGYGQDYFRGLIAFKEAVKAGIRANIDAARNE